MKVYTTEKVTHQSDKELMKFNEKWGFTDILMNDKKTGKPITLKELKTEIKAGEHIMIEGSENCGTISCVIKPDPWDGVIPVVIGSNHKRFTPGRRFDYGFMCIAIIDGFTIVYN